MLAINQPLVVQRPVLQSDSELNDTVFPATANYLCLSEHKVLMEVFCVLYIVINKTRYIERYYFHPAHVSDHNLGIYRIMGEGCTSLAFFSQNSVFCVINHHTFILNSRSFLNLWFHVSNRL